MSKPETVAVVGSRNYPDLHKVREYIDGLPYGTVIVSGGALGVDAEARKYATRYKGFHIESWEWSHYGKRIAAVRNELLVRFVGKVGGRVVIFSKRDENGKLTAGSQIVFDLCERLAVDVEVIE